MRNGIPAFTIADPGEHGNLESIPAFLLTQNPGTTLSIANAISMHAVLVKLIVEVREAKIDWPLRRSCCT